MVFGINKQKIEIFIIGVLGFGLTVFLLPFIERFIAGFIGYAYIPKLLSYVVGYIIIIYLWPIILWKMYIKLRR